MQHTFTMIKLSILMHNRVQYITLFSMTNSTLKSIINNTFSAIPSVCMCVCVCVCVCVRVRMHVCVSDT